MNSVGIPLDVVVDRLDSRGFIVDWTDFYVEAVLNGWPPERTLLRLKQVVGDVYGPQFREEWTRQMQEVINLLHRNHPDTAPIV